MKKIEVELMAFKALMHVTVEGEQGVRSGTFEFTHEEFHNLAQQTREATLNLDGYETKIGGAFEIELNDRVGGMVVVGKVAAEMEGKPATTFVFENRACMLATNDTIFSFERKIQ